MLSGMVTVKEIGYVVYMISFHVYVVC